MYRLGKSGRDEPGRLAATAQSGTLVVIVNERQAKYAIAVTNSVPLPIAEVAHSPRRLPTGSPLLTGP